MEVNSTDELNLGWCVPAPHPQVGKSWAPGRRHGHIRAWSSLVWTGHATSGHSTTREGLCSLICKMEGVGWITVKAPSSSGRIPASVSSFKLSVPQKKGTLLGKVAWNDGTGSLSLPSFYCRNCKRVCLPCQTGQILCENTPKGSFSLGHPIVLSGREHEKSPQEESSRSAFLERRVCGEGYAMISFVSSKCLLKDENPSLCTTLYWLPHLHQ